MSSRFVSIGMPVYNGGESLRRSLDGLLAQTHTHFELIISDNASTDETTRAITEEYAQRDGRIRLTRQLVNLGAVQNFVWLVQQARGDYFMWAAHDDFWSANYVETLANQLDSAPHAILATANSHVSTTRRNGVREEEMIPAAPNAGRDETLAVYIEQFKSCMWIYGMYRTQWLRTAAPEWVRYPWFCGDVIWLWGVLLQERVIGSPEATFYYTADHRLRKKQTYRQTVVMWGTTFYHLTRLSWQRLPKAERLSGVRKACRYFYLHHLRRNDPITTLVRIAKLAFVWLWIGVESGLRTLGESMKARWIKPVTHLTEQRLPLASRDGKQEARRAA